MQIEEKTQRRDWAGLAHGAYLLRTNCTEDDPSALWRWYIHLTQAEECFKISKSDLHLRPVFHQTTEPVEAHILVCFLTLALWRTLDGAKRRWPAEWLPGGRAKRGKCG